MTKTINPYDLFEISKSTGSSPSEVLEIAQREGWEITDSVPRQQATSSRHSVMNDPSRAVELMQQLREETIRKLYANDPIVRESIDAQRAIEASKGTQSKPSNFTYDQQGNLTGIKSSVVSGIKATANNQAELMKEIKNNIYKKYGVSK